MTLSMTLKNAILCIYDTQHNDSEHNVSQYVEYLTYAYDAECR